MAEGSRKGAGVVVAAVGRERGGGVDWGRGRWSRNSGNGESGREVVG